MSLNSFMRNIITLIVITLFGISCEKDYLIPNSEVPKWLREKISADEATISSDPKLMPNYGAWLRYEFQGYRYYEYDNPLSSLSRNPYSEAGVRVNTMVVPYTDYATRKCCERYVWKAPRYHQY